MIIILIPLLVAILGLLMWVLATNPKVQEMGKILFFCGVFWTVYLVSGKTTHIF